MMIFLISICLLGGFWETEADTVTGVLGEDITILCAHHNAFYNYKYFCKASCKNKDILISSGEQRAASNVKYNISDEGNIFYVTVSQLTEDDAGIYWCGVDRIGFDTYVKIDLRVIEGNSRDSEKGPRAQTSQKLLYVGAGLGVIVLSLAVALLIFFIHRSSSLYISCGLKHTQHPRDGKAPDTVYARPVCQKQDVRHSTAADGDLDTGGCGTNGIFSSSSAQHQDTSEYHAEGIYHEICFSSESQIQQDDPSYCTVSFSNTSC